MSETMHKAEVQLIAQEAADKAVAKHSEQIPKLMKPTMYEVAETVARRNKEDLGNLFTQIFGADVKNQEHMRDLHKDLYYLRDQRLSYEARKTLARQEIYRAIIKYVTMTVAAAMVSLAMLFKLSNPPPHL